MPSRAWSESAPHDALKPPFSAMKRGFQAPPGDVSAHNVPRRKSSAELDCANRANDCRNGTIALEGMVRSMEHWTLTPLGNGLETPFSSPFACPGHRAWHVRGWTSTPGRGACANTSPMGAHGGRARHVPPWRHVQGHAPGEGRPLPTGHGLPPCDPY